MPELEDRLVVSLDRAPGGFLVGLEGGETVTAQRVVLAVGITHFEYVPANLAHLPQEYLSHSFHHHDLEALPRPQGDRDRRRLLGHLIWPGYSVMVMPMCIWWLVHGH